MRLHVGQRVMIDPGHFEFNPGAVITALDDQFVTLWWTHMPQLKPLRYPRSWAETCMIDDEDEVPI